MHDDDEVSTHVSEDVELVNAEGHERLDGVRRLFRAYAAEISREAGAGAVLEVQGFDEELARLPGDYAPPNGALLLALVDGVEAGCVALRPHGDRVAEIKRLYVDEPYRGRSLGFKLVDELITRARSLGYQRLRLDTLPFMRIATRLYRAFEFEEIAPYRENPMAGARFFELDLRNEEQG